MERLETELGGDGPVGNGDGRIPLLSVEGLQAGYGRKHVVFDVDLQVYEGEVVGILGHNGSGKSTTIKAILGINPAQGGRAVYAGRDVTRAGSKSNVRAGMALIPSERFVFPDLTVLDNLLLGARTSATQSNARVVSISSTSCSRSCATGPCNPPAHCQAVSSAW